MVGVGLIVFMGEARGGREHAGSVWGEAGLSTHVP